MKVIFESFKAINYKTWYTVELLNFFNINMKDFQAKTTTHDDMTKKDTYEQALQNSCEQIRFNCMQALSKLMELHACSWQAYVTKCKLIASLWNYMQALEPWVSLGHLRWSWVTLANLR